jgi:hypothetical protein
MHSRPGLLPGKLDAIAERVAQYMNILAKYYGSVDYLAFTQVLTNLAHDPRTSQQTRETMARIGESANPGTAPRQFSGQRRLLADAFGMLIENSASSQ